jgi:hypothetical protein
MADLETILGPVDQGRTILAIDEVWAGPDTKSTTVLITSDSVLVSVWVETITGGTLSVVCSTVTQEGREFEIINFPPVAAHTTQLLLRKASLALSKIKVTATTTGSCTFQVHVKGINIGETTTKIAGSAAAVAIPYIATSTPAILIPATLQDRAAVQILNNGPSGTLYIGFDASQATVGNGYPVGVGGYWSGDLAAGGLIYASTSGPAIDVRTIQAFG